MKIVMVIVIIVAAAVRGYEIGCNTEGLLL
jgi:hypothetical protein